MAKDGKVRFVRINGRVVPIRGKGSAPAGVSKRYGAKREITRPKSIGVSRGAVSGALAGAFAKPASDLISNMKFTKGKIGPSLGNAMRRSNFGSGSLKRAAIGAVLGATIGSIKVYRKGKGESDRQLAARVAGLKKKNKSGV